MLPPYEHFGWVAIHAGCTNHACSDLNLKQTHHVRGRIVFTSRLMVRGVKKVPPFHDILRLQNPFRP